MRLERRANHHDRLCDRCKYPMIGIMKCSDQNGYSAPRRLCVDCSPNQTPIDGGKAA